MEEEQSIARSAGLGDHRKHGFIVLDVVAYQNDPSLDQAMLTSVWITSEMVHLLDSSYEESVFDINSNHVT